MYENIFNLKHIFVLFPPGGSGNFISSLLRSIVNEDFSPINLSATGNAHAFWNTSVDEVFSCGLINSVPFFSSLEEKIRYYRNEILKKYHNVDTPIVSWTHDYSNLEIYKVLFPNAKILALTQETKRERIIQTVLLHLKNRMDPAGVISLSDDIFKERWLRACRTKLLRLLPGKDALVEKILNNRFDSKYFDLVFYTSITYDFELFNLTNETMFDYSDHCFASRFELNAPATRSSTVPFCIFNHNSYYYNQLKDTMEFDIIVNNNHARFCQVIEGLLERSLSEHERSFIKHSLQNYHSKQPYMLFSDYKEYINQLKESAMTKLKNIKAEL